MIVAKTLKDLASALRFPGVHKDAAFRMVKLRNKE
jgi:hypothetical protein